MFKPGPNKILARMKDGVFSEKLLELVVRVVVGILNEF